MEPIILNFRNYKKLKNSSFTLKDSNIYLIKASNGQGKTTFLNAVKSLQIAKLDNDQPVTLGEEHGSIEAINLVGADGKPYIVRCTFNKVGDAKFVCIDETGKKITSVKEIRDIFKFSHFTAEQFMQMSLNASGKEEAKKIFLSLLTEQQKKDYEIAMLLEKKYYKERTDANSLKTTLETLVQQSCPTADENELIKGVEGAKEKLKALKEEYSAIAVEEEKQKGINVRLKDIDSSMILLQAEVDALLKQIEEKKAQIVSLGKGQVELLKLKKDIPDATVLKERIQKGEGLIANATAVQLKKQNYETNKQKLAEATTKWQDLDEKVLAERNKQDSIIANSKNPIKELRYTDDGLFLGELSFKENQISKGDAMLVGLELQCVINESPIILAGSANDWDNKHLDKAAEIAKRYGMILILDEVVREQQEIAVIGYDHTNK